MSAFISIRIRSQNDSIYLDKLDQTNWMVDNNSNAADMHSFETALFFNLKGTETTSAFCLAQHIIKVCTQCHIN